MWVYMLACEHEMTTRCEDLEPSSSGTGGTRVELFSYQAS